MKESLYEINEGEMCIKYMHMEKESTCYPRKS